MKPAEEILAKHTQTNLEKDWERNGKFSITNYKAAMIEFAKLHVEAALRSATHVLDVNADADWIKHPTTEDILNSYPLSKIL